MAKISTRRKTIPVELEDDSGVVRKFTLKELSGPLRDKYLNFQQTKFKFTADGKSQTIKDVTGLYTKLIAESLFDENGNSVPESVIDTWSSSAQSELFKLAQKLSGLDNKAEEDAKND